MKIYLLAFLITIPSMTASRLAFAQACTTLEDSGKYKNTFVCPVRGGAKVRASDACAPNGGGSFRASREGNRYHNALDLNAAEKTDVLATKPGKVAVADGDFGKMGGTVVIDHEDGDYSVYGHLTEVKAKKGACVNPGDLVGTVGYSGNGACLKEKGLSAHLHFAVIRAAQIGLADAAKPISTAVKNGDDWLELAKEVFPGDNLDLGIKDPEPLLKKVPGCLK